MENPLFKWLTCGDKKFLLSYVTLKSFYSMIIMNMLILSRIKKEYTYITTLNSERF